MNLFYLFVKVIYVVFKFIFSNYILYVFIYVVYCLLNKMLNFIYLGIK